HLGRPPHAVCKPGTGRPYRGGKSRINLPSPIATGLFRYLDQAVDTLHVGSDGAIPRRDAEGWTDRATVIGGRWTGGAPRSSQALSGGLSQARSPTVPRQPKDTVAILGIDIGKNTFHPVGPTAIGMAKTYLRILGLIRESNGDGA